MLSGLDSKRLAVLEMAAQPSGIRASEAASILGLSRSAARTWLEKKDLIRKEIPHKNPRMPPTYIYHLQGNISIEDLRRSLETSSLETLENSALEKPPFDPHLALFSLKPSSREEHLKVLSLVEKRGTASLNQVTEGLSGSRKQTIHSRLERLRNLGFLEREKRQGVGTQEFFYFLSPNVSLNEINSLRSSYGDPDSLKSLSTADKAEVHNLTNSLPETSDPYAVLAKQLVQKLPEFDPTWSDDFKKAWFSSYEQLVKMSIPQQMGKST